MTPEKFNPNLSEGGLKEFQEPTEGQANSERLVIGSSETSVDDRDVHGEISSLAANISGLGITKPLRGSKIDVSQSPDVSELPTDNIRLAFLAKPNDGALAYGIMENLRKRTS